MGSDEDQEGKRTSVKASFHARRRLLLVVVGYSFLGNLSTFVKLVSCFLPEKILLYSPDTCPPSLFAKTSTWILDEMQL